jgi:hypothetical protein
MAKGVSRRPERRARAAAKKAKSPQSNDVTEVTAPLTPTPARGPSGQEPESLMKTMLGSAREAMRT